MVTLIDLKAHFIPATRNIWIVHPGKNRQYFDDFLKHDAIFLGFPGIRLSPRILASDDALRQRIRYSIALRAAGGLTRSDGTTIRISDFPGGPGSDTSVHLRTIKHLTSRMAPKDIVIVPGRGADGRVLFGEVDGDFSDQDQIRPTGIGFADVPIRKVDWTSKNYFKPDLPRGLVKLFEKPPAIAEVQRSQFTDRFFDYVYQSYYTPTYSSSIITANDYDGRDILSVVAPTQLLAFAIALYKAQQSGEDYSRLLFDGLIAKYYDDNILEDARLRFASPGRYGLRDKDSTLTLFINAIVALALASQLAACGAAPNSLSIENSAAHDQAKNAYIMQMVQNAAASAGASALANADHHGAKAKKIAMRTPAEVR